MINKKRIWKNIFIMFLLLLSCNCYSLVTIEEIRISCGKAPQVAKFNFPPNPKVEVGLMTIGMRKIGGDYCITAWNKVSLKDDYCLPKPNVFTNCNSIGMPVMDMLPEKDFSAGAKFCGKGETMRVSVYAFAELGYEYVATLLLSDDGDDLEKYAANVGGLDEYVFIGGDVEQFVGSSTKLLEESIAGAINYRRCSIM